MQNPSGRGGDRGQRYAAKPEKEKRQRQIVVRLTPAAAENLDAAIAAGVYKNSSEAVNKLLEGEKPPDQTSGA